MNRDNLVEEVGKIFPMCKDNAEDIADFILEDRKRICEPLINHKKLWCGNWIEYTSSYAIDETLQRAGLIGDANDKTT